MEYWLGTNLHSCLMLLQPTLPGSMNGMWAIPCVWVDATAALYPAINPYSQTTFITLSNPTPTQPFTPDWAPYQHAPDSVFKLGAHPFGAIEPMGSDLIGNLSPEDAQFLNASFPLVEPVDEPMVFDEEFGGGSALGLQLGEVPSGNGGPGPIHQSTVFATPPTPATPAVLPLQTARASDTELRTCEFDSSTTTPVCHATSTPTPVDATQLQVPHAPNPQVQTHTLPPAVAVTATTPHVCRHSTQIGIGYPPFPGNPAWLAESPNPNALCRQASLAGYRIPSAPAVGNCSPLSLAADATAASHH
ncbi:hypothetical protein FRC09_006130, partial [Ceratobasidium sp. 395]